MVFPKNRLNDIETKDPKVELDEIEHLVDVTKKKKKLLNDTK